MWLYTDVPKRISQDATLDVKVQRSGLTDVLARLDPPKGDERLASLVQSLGDGERSLGFTLGSDDGGLTLLLGLSWREERQSG